MNGRILALAVAGALGVLVYALYVLVDRDEPRSEPNEASQRVPVIQGEDDGQRPAPFVRVGAEERKDERGTARPRPVLPPAQPPPPPKMDLEEAREELSDLLAELDRELDRSAEGARPMSNERWVEYYRRGNEAIAAIAQARKDDKDASQEISEAHHELRWRLDRLQAPTTND